MTTTGFLYRFLTFSAALALVAAGLQYAFGHTRILSPHFWVLFAVLALVTIAAYLLAAWGIRIGGQWSVLSIMGSIFFKFLFALVAVWIILRKQTDNQTIFVLNFFSVYFCFSVFEVICLLRNLRHQNKM